MTTRRRPAAASPPPAAAAPPADRAPGELPITHDQVFGLVRSGLAAGGGYLMAKGIVGQPEIDLALSLAPIAGAAVWSFLAKRPLP